MKYMTVEQVREYLQKNIIIEGGSIINFRKALKDGLVIEPKDTIPQLGIEVVEDGDKRLDA